MVRDICRYQYNFVIIFIKKYLIGIYLPNYLVTNITLWVNSKIVHKYQIMRDRETKREREPGGSVSSSMDNKLQILKKKGNILKFQ